MMTGLISMAAAQHKQNKELLLKATNYVLDITPDYHRGTLSANCQLTITNPSGEAIKSIPLLLYRLMRITAITDHKGAALSFTQQVQSFEDFEVLQANVIQVELNKPLLQGEQMEINIDYGGHLLGYTETGMSYLHDKISPDYTMIRTDCMAYPKLGYPSMKTNRAAGFERFNYLISVNVPDSLTVANGGKLESIINEDGISRYTYSNIKPAWRIDIAISSLNVLTTQNLKIFYIPEDSTGAKQIMKKALETFNLYVSWWGELDDFQGFSIIEIPENWGSQADVSCIIQTAAAFKEKDLDIELYHEISHIWNVRPTDTYPPRWDEGLAMFLMYLTQDKLNDTNTIEEKTQKFIKRINANPAYKEVPLIDYGKENVAGRSYSMGMVMFSMLYQLIGEADFNKSIGYFYQRYHQSGGSTEDFIQLVDEVSPLDLRPFFDDWVYTTAYTDLLKQDLSMADYINYYKN